MYRRDAIAIQQQCRESPYAFRDVLVFVLSTIQEPLERVPGIVADVRKNGRNSSFLWGMKRKGFDDIQAHYRTLYDAVMVESARKAPHWEVRTILKIVDSIHGINLAKAGFILQLTVGAAGCIDSHNLRRFGLSKITVNPRMTPRTRVARAALYLETCRRCGGTERLWDSWCDYVSELRPNVWPTGSDVSRAHMVAVSAPF